MANIMTGVPVSTLPQSEHSSISYAHARVRGMHARTSVQFSSGLSSPLRSVAATSTFKRAFLSEFLSKHSNMVPEQEQQEPALEIKRKAKTREERMATIQAIPNSKRPALCVGFPVQIPESGET